MSGGGGTNTVVQNSQPPPQFMAAYENVQNQAQAAAAQPLQQYQGLQVAPINGEQNLGINQFNNAQGFSLPYQNAATSAITNSTAPLLPTVQPYLDTARSYYGTAGDLGMSLSSYEAPYASGAEAAYQNSTNVAGGLPSAISPWANTAGGLYGASATPLTPTQFSAGQVNQYESPYTAQVVGATEQQFNNQNALQQQQVSGNAISQGAFGGDREAVAHAITAGQEQLAQAPVIAGLENTGYSQALGEFNTQQQVGLGAQEATRQLEQGAGAGLIGAGQAMTQAQEAEMQGLQGAGAGQLNIGALQSQTGAAEAGLELQAGQGTAAVGQTALGANEADAWLNSQAGFGYANLANQVYGQAMGAGSAEMGAGGLEQSVQQEQLNIPAEQFVAQQAYPFQTTQFLANVSEGLGGASGGTSNTTSPGPSALSQVGGAGLTGLAAYGLLNSTGALAGLEGLVGGGGGLIDAGLIAKRGGAIPERAGGGGLHIPGIGRMQGGIHVPNMAHIAGPNLPRMRFADGGAPDIHITEGDDFGDSGGPFSIPSDNGGLPIPPIPPGQGQRARRFAGPPGTGDGGLPLPPPPAPAPDNNGGAGLIPSAPTWDRRVQQGQNNSPWTTLLAAGLGIMGGTSPHALVNIGRGGMQGLEFGEQQRAREASESLRALQAEDLASYRSGQLQNTANRNETYSQRVQEQTSKDQAAAALSMARAAHVQAGHVSEGDITAQAVNSLVGTPNSDTGKPWTRSEAFMHVRGVDSLAARRQAETDQGAARLDQGNERLDQSGQRIRLTQQEMALRDAAIRRGQDFGSANADIRTAGSMVDSGEAPDVPTAMKQIQAGRAAQQPRQPTTPTAQPDTGGGSPADPLGIR